MVVDGKPEKVISGSTALLASVMTNRPKKFSEYDLLSQVLPLVANPIIVI